MKATGIVRRVDELGRIVIPKELRRVMGINVGDSLEIFTDNNNIILKKYSPFCIFCGSSEAVLSYNGKCICSKCLENIKNIIE